MSTHRTLRLLAAFAAIYVIWGSTYLAIKVLVGVLPPLLTAAVRSALAGGILLLWARARGAPLPGPRLWLQGLGAGALMFLLGHGLLFWASQRVASGLAAVGLSTIPLWVALFSAVGSDRYRPTWPTRLGLIMGLGGVLWLNLPSSGAEADPLASLALLIGAGAWALAMVWYRGPRRPRSAALAAAVPLIGGGGLLFVASFALGEPARTAWRAVTPLALACMAYVVVFGSVLAFSAFVWLVGEVSPTAVASYAYVNPAVALILGWTVGGEPFVPHALLPIATILSAVALIVWSQPPVPAGATTGIRGSARAEGGAASGGRPTAARIATRGRSE
jgi:drug/metabolite transporter (DMT)-like permease